MAGANAESQQLGNRAALRTLAIDRDVNSDVKLPPANLKHSRGVHKAGPAQSVEEGRSRLTSGGFVAYRGHGAIDNNRGVALAVQERLRDLGYLSDSQVTGYFGRHTEVAVARFQADYNQLMVAKGREDLMLPPDRKGPGIVGRQTWDALYHSKKVEPTTAEHSPKSTAEVAPVIPPKSDLSVIPPVPEAATSKENIGDVAKPAANFAPVVQAKTSAPAVLPPVPGGTASRVDDAGSSQKPTESPSSALAKVPSGNDVLADSQVGKKEELAPAMKTMLANTYFARGRAHLNSNEIGEAIIDYSRGLELRPDDPMVLLDRGFCYGYVGKRAEAIVDLSKVLEVSPKESKAYYLRGENHAHLGKLDAAIEDFTSSITINPYQEIAFFQRGVAYALQGRHDDAIADLNKAVELDPNSKRAYLKRGDSYIEKNDFERACSDYSKVTELDPKSIDAYMNLGQCRALRAQWTQSIEAFSRASAIDPNYAAAYHGRGITLSVSGKDDEAIADFSIAISLEQKNAATYWQRGQSYATLGKHSEAIADFSKAIEIDVKYAKAYLGRSASYRALGKEAEATADHDRAVNLNPEIAK